MSPFNSEALSGPLHLLLSQFSILPIQSGDTSLRQYGRVYSSQAPVKNSLATRMNSGFMSPLNAMWPA